MDDDPRPFLFYAVKMITIYANPRERKRERESSGYDVHYYCLNEICSCSFLMSISSLEISTAKCIFLNFFLMLHFSYIPRYNRYYDSCFCFIFKMHQNILSNPDCIIPRVETIHRSQVSKGEDYLQLTDACYSMDLLHTKAQTCTTYPRPWYVVVAITMVTFIYRKNVYYIWSL